MRPDLVRAILQFRAQATLLKVPLVVAMLLEVRLAVAQLVELAVLVVAQAVVEAKQVPYSWP